jgi:HD-GYP domain-containing protein (c-di-GMP phosphodiesterase class II)
MEYSPATQPAGSAVDHRTLQTVMRMVARVERLSQPEMFSHVQPHAHATARLTRFFAGTCIRTIASDGPTLDEIQYGALMHDIGKYFIDSVVLLKPSALDEEEEAVMRLHPIYGATTISKLPAITNHIRQIVLHHHEHWDGSGYPGGLCGTRIPLAARLVSVVDVYTALRSRRSYKPTLSKWKAIVTLIEMAGRELDPSLVEDFIKMVCDKERNEPNYPGHSLEIDT